MFLAAAWQLWDLERYAAEGKDWSYALGGGATPTRTVRLFAPKTPHATGTNCTTPLLLYALESCSQMLHIPKPSASPSKST